MAACFADRLARLPPADHLAAIVLRGPDDAAECIDNRPGSQGSLRVYAYLADKHGAITPAAASEGLELYAEHVADARAHPGKHPNIDRLLRAAGSGLTYRVELRPAEAA